MSLEWKPLEIGPWLPDLPPLENPGALLAKNCLPRAHNSYCELNSLSSFSDALASAALGSIWLQGSDNTIYNFAGTATTLEQLSGGNTWNDVSIAGGYTGVTNWEFVKFGDRVCAFADGEDPQYFDVGTSSLFADLAGSPPQAARAAVVRDFIMLGDLAAFGPNFIGWSGFNSSELWTPSRATQSDRQELFGKGGRVQKILPGEYGIIFMEHSIWRADYVGPPLIFQLDEVEKQRGTPAPNSVAWTGAKAYFYSHDGFYEFDGVASTPIGVDVIDDWFATEADESGLDTMRGVVDRQNRLVLWAFRSTTSITYNDRILIYNWGTNRWSYAELDTQILGEFVSSGFTLDGLDTPLPAGIDIDSINVDSDAFKGGVLGLQAFDTSNQSADFSGAPLTAEIDTAEWRGTNGKRLFTNKQRPNVDGTPATVIQLQAGTRDLQTGNVTFGPLRGLNSNGETNIRKDSRYHRYRLNIAGGFNHAHGLELFARETGGR